MPLENLVVLWRNCESRVKEASKARSGGVAPAVAIDNLRFEGVPKGRRNSRAFEIARKLKSQGVSVNEAKAIVKEWNRKNRPPEKDIQSLYRTVESVCTYNIQDSGSIEITKHLRTDPYFSSFDNDQKAIYIYMIIHLNEVEKIVWGKYVCKPNQFITSYSTLARENNVGIGKVRSLIRKLKQEGRITVETLKTPDGYSACSRITFHCFDLTQDRTQDSHLRERVKNGHKD